MPLLGFLVDRYGKRTWMSTCPVYMLNLEVLIALYV